MFRSSTCAGAECFQGLTTVARLAYQHLARRNSADISHEAGVQARQLDLVASIAAQSGGGATAAQLVLQQKQE
jgi:hypothetical protein